MDNQKQDNNDRKYKLAPIILALIVIAIGSVNLYVNLPIPNLEVGMFPEKGIIYSNTVKVTAINSSANQMVFNITAGNGAHSDYNFTFQVYNSGKGIARNIEVSLTGEPTETFKVISTYVFVGEPLNSNLLDVVDNDYQIGLLGSGKSYCFLFSVQLAQTDDSTQGEFILKVTSENAGTFTEIIAFQ
jgi:hypothetical protein